jgi:hypothetical protein
MYTTFSSQFCSDVCRNNLQLEYKNDYLKEDESVFYVILTSFRVPYFMF